MGRRNIVCETSRLILRYFTPDDLSPLAAMHLDVEVARFIGGVKTLEQTRERLERWLAEYERYGFSKWAVVLRGSEELIGRCGLSPEQIDGVDEWELGWTFARALTGCRATQLLRVCRAVADHPAALRTHKTRPCRYARSSARSARNHLIPEFRASATSTHSALPGT